MIPLQDLGHAASIGLAVILGLALATWLASVIKRNAGIVDCMWGIFLLAAALAYGSTLPDYGPRATWLLALVMAWSLRLSIHIAWRNWGHPEELRYRQIRERNQPGFAWKSIYLIFLLQGVLAWILSLPLLAALAGTRAPNWLDAAGSILCAFGIMFEAIADAQLTRFKTAKARGGVGAEILDTGLWRYTRHPNYFGECCVWWGFYLIALAAGGWWTIVAPIMITFLLLKVSGVALLEKNMVEHRPAYRDYIARTNAFFPSPPRPSAEIKT